MTWFLLLPFWAVMQVAAYALAPILPAFAEWREGPLDNNTATGNGYRLPLWLAWFDTPDNAITGDYGFWTENPDSYGSMVKWLWRNPAVGFDAYVLSAVIASNSVVDKYGNPQVQDAPKGLQGFSFTVVDNYWNLVYIKKISATRCIKLDLGWQLKTFAEGSPLTPSARYAMSIRFPTFKQQTNM